jgi:hypothetical protein
VNQPVSQPPASRLQAAQLAAEQAAQDLGTQAFGTPGESATTDADIAAGAGAASGTTEADMDAMWGMLKRMQAQLDATDRANAAARGEEPVRTLVRALVGFVKVHADPAAVTLADDATDAVSNLLDNGGSDTGPLEKIVGKIARQLLREPPHPGENFHYNQALALATRRVPDAIEDFEPPPSSRAAAVTSDRAPAKVLAGSVTG